MGNGHGAPGLGEVVSYGGWVALRNLLLVCFLVLLGLSIHKVQTLDECHARGGEWAFYHCEIPK